MQCKLEVKLECMIAHSLLTGSVLQTGHGYCMKETPANVFTPQQIVQHMSWNLIYLQIIRKPLPNKKPIPPISG